MGDDHEVEQMKESAVTLKMSGKFWEHCIVGNITDLQYIGSNCVQTMLGITKPTRCLLLGQTMQCLFKQSMHWLFKLNLALLLDICK